MYVSLAVIGISGIIGTALGIMAAYFGGWVDYSISRLIDIFMALPGILVLLVLVVGDWSGSHRADCRYFRPALVQVRAIDSW